MNLGFKHRAVWALLSASAFAQDAATQREARERWFLRGHTSAPHAAARSRVLRPRAQGVTGNVSNADGWTPVGPLPLMSDPNNTGQVNYVAGRVTAVAIDPNDLTGNTVYAGGAFRGVWKSTNAASPVAANVAWKALTDDQATLAIGATSVGIGVVDNPDFSVAVPNHSLSANVGETVTFSVIATAIDGYNNPVNLSCGPGAPPLCSVTSSTITPTASGVTATVTLQSSEAKNYSFRVVAASQDTPPVTRTADITFVHFCVWFRYFDVAAADHPSGRQGDLYTHACAPSSGDHISQCHHDERLHRRASVEHSYGDADFGGGGQRVDHAHSHRDHDRGGLGVAWAEPIGLCILFAGACVVASFGSGKNSASGVLLRSGYWRSPPFLRRAAADSPATAAVPMGALEQDSHAPRRTITRLRSALRPLQGRRRRRSRFR